MVLTAAGAGCDGPSARLSEICRLSTRLPRPKKSTACRQLSASRCHHPPACRGRSVPRVRAVSWWMTTRMQRRLPHCLQPRKKPILPCSAGGSFIGCCRTFPGLRELESGRPQRAMRSGPRGSGQPSSARSSFRQSCPFWRTRTLLHSSAQAAGQRFRSWARCGSKGSYARCRAGSTAWPCFLTGSLLPTTRRTGTRPRRPSSRLSLIGFSWRFTVKSCSRSIRAKK